MIKVLSLCLVLLLTGCELFKPAQKPEAVARVNDEYLFRQELQGIVPAGSQQHDSILIVQSYITRWATQKLLVDAAQVNLSDARKADFDALVRQYQTDLFIRAYLEELVKQSVDTVVTQNELIAFYKQNKENFRTTGMLVKLRFINLDKDNPKYETIKTKFFDFRKSDKNFWATYSLQLRNFALNDSVWVEMNHIYSKLPFITPENRDSFIIPGKTIQHPDGDNIYLVKVVNALDKNQVAPYEYIRPTLKEVILNQRKLELIRKIEKEITDDALKDKKFEIYK
jgi:hypothetical protein